MPCKFCRTSLKKSKVKILFKVGNRYETGNSVYICANLGNGQYALINLATGNRWYDPTAFLQCVGYGSNDFKEVI